MVQETVIQVDEALLVAPVMGQEVTVIVSMGSNWKECETYLVVIAGPVIDEPLVQDKLQDGEEIEGEAELVIGYIDDDPDNELLVKVREVVNEVEADEVPASTENVEEIEGLRAGLADEVAPCDVMPDGAFVEVWVADVPVDGVLVSNDNECKDVVVKDCVTRLVDETDAMVETSDEENGVATKDVNGDDIADNIEGYGNEDGTVTKLGRLVIEGNGNDNEDGIVIKLEIDGTVTKLGRVVIEGNGNEDGIVTKLGRVVIDGNGNGNEDGIAIKLEIDGNGNGSEDGIAIKLEIDGNGNGNEDGIAIKLEIDGNGNGNEDGTAIKLVRAVIDGNGTGNEDGTAIKLEIEGNDTGNEDGTAIKLEIEGNDTGNEDGTAIKLEIDGNGNGNEDGTAIKLGRVVIDGNDNEDGTAIKLVRAVIDGNDTGSEDGTAIKLVRAVIDGNGTGNEDGSVTKLVSAVTDGNGTGNEDGTNTKLVRAVIDGNGNEDGTVTKLVRAVIDGNDNEDGTVTKLVSVVIIEGNGNEDGTSTELGRVYLLSVSTTTIAILRATPAVSAGLIADGAREVSTAAKQFQSVKLLVEARFADVVRLVAREGFAREAGNVRYVTRFVVEGVGALRELGIRDGILSEDVKDASDVAKLVGMEIKDAVRLVIVGVGALSELVIRDAISSEDAKDASDVAKLVGIEIKDAARLVVGEEITREGIGNTIDVAKFEPNWEQHPPKAPLGSQVAPSKSTPHLPSILGPEELSEVIDVVKEELLVLDDEAMIGMLSDRVILELLKLFILEGIIVTIGNRELGLMLLDVVVVGIITTEVVAYPPNAPLGSHVAPLKSAPHRPSILGIEELADIVEVEEGLLALGNVMSVEIDDEELLPMLSPILMLLVLLDVGMILKVVAYPPNAPLGSHVAPLKSAPHRPSILGGTDGAELVLGKEDEVEDESEDKGVIVIVEMTLSVEELLILLVVEAVTPSEHPF
ncbi:MAG: Extracellular matrix protein fras1 [Candelina mexicana]|nr:MAG: Extracellular matrix protein fras1 [Candelina mexicana]